MKKSLYVLLIGGKDVVALSEDKYLLINYIIQKKIKFFDIVKLTDKKQISSYLLYYDDLILENNNDVIITQGHNTAFENEIIQPEKSIIHDTLNNLDHMINNYAISDNEKDKLIETRDLLMKFMKPKKLDKILQVKEFLEDVSQTSLMEYINEMNNLYSNAIFEEVVIDIGDDDER